MRTGPESGRERRCARFLTRLLGTTIAVAAFAALPGVPAPAQTKAPARPAPERQERPNFLIIMADDLGYSDIGAYGGDIDTPNLDALARQSVKLTNFYNLSRCSPSRASLLTGRYPHRVNMGENGTSLAQDVPTVAEELVRAGYATDMVGKWHLSAAAPIADRAEHLKWLNHQGYFDKDFADKATYPAARGFQHHYGIIWGIADYYDPFSLVEDFTPVRSVPKDFYLTHALTTRAVKDIGKLAPLSQPFMMYLAYTAAHWPLQAPEGVIRKYLPRYAGGWEAMQKRRYDRQVKLGLVDPKTTPMPVLSGDYANNGQVAWANLTPDQRAIQTRKMATHAAMVEELDRGVGQVIAELRKSGDYDNTVVIFLADNGASPEIMVQPGYDRPSETRDGRTIQYGEYQTGIGSETTMAGIGAFWANAANTPWRYWKAEQYDGGVHTPFLISWPGHMGDRAGTTDADFGHITDVTPTLLDLAGVRPSPAPQPIDGISLLPVLRGEKLERGAPIFFEHEGGRAVIDGKWKLVSLAPGRKGETWARWSLYDLSVDRNELHDVAAANPEIAANMAAKWTAWAHEVGVRMRKEP